MSTSDKFFSETVTLPSATPTSLATILRTAGYGFEKDANNNITTTPSLASFNGTSGAIIPSNTVWFGHDQYVRDNPGVGPPRTYKGVPAVAGQPFSLEEFCRGIVDPNTIWMYTPGLALSMEVVFVAF